MKLASSKILIPRKTHCFLNFKAMMLASSSLQKQWNALQRSIKVLVSGSQVQTKKQRIYGKIANMHLYQAWELILERAAGLQTSGKNHSFLADVMLMG